MSLLSGLVKSVANVGRSILGSPVTSTLGRLIPGIGTAVATAATAYQTYQALKTPAVGAVMPGAGSVMANQISPIAAMPTMQAGFLGTPFTPAQVGRAAAAGVKYVRRIPAAAAALCRKYPQWCSTIGGTVAVEALFHTGQLPLPKRRRSRGISGRELKDFRRVARFMSKYSAPIHRAMRAPALRRHRRI